MYLKVNEDSPIYGDLYDVFATDNIRNINFVKWQQKNLPEYNREVLTQRSVLWLQPIIVGWKFVGEVDKKTWQPVKGFEGYYAPNLHTKAGRDMNTSILIAQGERYCRLDFFKMFKTSHHFGRKFVAPYGFAHRGVCYMMFDDGCYRDIQQKMAGKYEEISREEFESVMKAYDEEREQKYLKL